MRKDTEALLETVLAAVMAPETDALTLATTLRNTLADAPAMAVIRALLEADQVILETFAGTSTGRDDAELARSLAFTLVKAADDLSHIRKDRNRVRLSDLLL